MHASAQTGAAREGRAARVAPRMMRARARGMSSDQNHASQRQRWCECMRTVLHHLLQELDDHLRRRAHEHLALAALLGVVDGAEAVVEHRDANHGSNRGSAGEEGEIREQKGRGARGRTAARAERARAIFRAGADGRRWWASGERIQGCWGCRCRACGHAEGRRRGIVAIPSCHEFLRRVGIFEVRGGREFAHPRPASQLRVQRPWRPLRRRATPRRTAGSLRRRRSAG